MMTMINIVISIHLIDGQVLADEKVFVCQITDDKTTGSVIIIVGAFSFCFYLYLGFPVPVRQPKPYTNAKLIIQ